MIRERVDHPATAKELLRVLRIPREERASFKRRLRALVASGAAPEEVESFTASLRSRVEQLRAL